MRAVLTPMLIAVGVYSLFCLVMVIANRSKERASRLFDSILFTDGLSEVGLRYRRRYLLCVLVAGALAILWFIFVEPI